MEIFQECLSLFSILRVSDCVCDDDNIVRVMPAVTLAEDLPLFIASFKHVLFDVATDCSIRKIRINSILQGHGLWPSFSGTTEAQAKKCKTNT